MERPDPRSRQPQRPQRRRRKKRCRLNPHLILLAVILLIAAVSLIKLVIWNIGTRSDYDPENLEDGFDVEALDTIVPLPASALEGREDDGVTTILCLGNNPLTDEDGENSFTSLLAKKTGAEVYHGGFPDSTIGTRYSVYNEEYPDDNFNLPHVAGSIASGDFGRLEAAAALKEDPGYASSVETLRSLDYQNVDMIVLVYDAADYLARIPSDNPNDPYELSAYTGGLRTALEGLQQAYPHIRIVIMSHSFAQYVDENGEHHSGGGTDLGNGALPHYLVKQVDVALSCKVSIIDNFYGSIHEDNFQKYLSDHIHLNDAGRNLLAERLAELVNTGRTSVK